MVFGVDTGREVEGRGQIRIEYAEEQCFKFGLKELWRVNCIVCAVKALRVVNVGYGHFKRCEGRLGLVLGLVSLENILNPERSRQHSC